MINNSRNELMIPLITFALIKNVIVLQVIALNTNDPIKYYFKSNASLRFLLFNLLLI